MQHDNCQRASIIALWVNSHHIRMLVEDPYWFLLSQWHRSTLVNGTNTHWSMARMRIACTIYRYTIDRCTFEEVQFGFAHFVSHFIRIQIFQIDLPLNLYLKGISEHISINSVLLIFDASNSCTDIWRKTLVFFPGSVIFLSFQVGFMAPEVAGCHHAAPASDMW